MQALALARDLELIRAWQAGDRTAGATLLDHYRNLVFRACHRTGVRAEDDILELWQELGLGEIPDGLKDSE